MAEIDSVAEPEALPLRTLSVDELRSHLQRLAQLLRHHEEALLNLSRGRETPAASRKASEAAGIEMEPKLLSREERRALMDTPNPFFRGKDIHETVTNTTDSSAAPPAGPLFPHVAAAYAANTPRGGPLRLEHLQTSLDAENRAMDLESMRSRRSFTMPTEDGVGPLIAHNRGSVRPHHKPTMSVLLSQSLGHPLHRPTHSTVKNLMRTQSDLRVEKGRDVDMKVEVKREIDTQPPLTLQDLKGSASQSPRSPRQEARTRQLRAWRYDGDDGSDEDGEHDDDEDDRIIQRTPIRTNTQAVARGVKPLQMSDSGYHAPIVPVPVPPISFADVSLASERRSSGRAFSARLAAAANNLTRSRPQSARASPRAGKNAIWQPKSPALRSNSLSKKDKKYISVAKEILESDDEDAVEERHLATPRDPVVVRAQRSHEAVSPRFRQKILAMRRSRQ